MCVYTTATSCMHVQGSNNNLKSETVGKVEEQMHLPRQNLSHYSNVIPLYPDPRLNYHTIMNIIIIISKWSVHIMGLHATVKPLYSGE